ncbi:MAG: hypothetical protein ACRCTP_00575 [Aeromonas popoffii]|uniref:hypothetical protein n=1 Tax=Aeromonas popoffii TaxID=70856 RepID=UPI003F3579AD
MFGNATAKNLNDLSKDDFLKITGPVVSSSSFDIDARNSVYLATFPSDIGVCTKLVDGELVVSGMPEFASRVKQAYARAKPTLKFGSAYAKAPPKEEGPPLVPTTVVQSVKAPEFDVAYFWNEEYRSKDSIYKELFGLEPNFQHQSMFDRYNEHLKEMVLPGEMVIIVAGETQTLSDQDHLRHVKENAKAASEGIQQLTPAEASTMQRNLALLDYIATLELSTPSAAIGGLSAVMSQRFTDLNKALADLNSFYVAHAGAAKGGNFSSEFYTGRKARLANIDNAVNRLTMSGVKIAPYTKIKSTLGLSTKSVLHNWRSVTRYHEVPALGERMKQISKYVKGAERLGWVSVALDATSGGMKSYEAWQTGDDTLFARVTVREIGRVGGAFTGGAIAAEASATVGVAVVGGMALAIGVTVSAPVLAIVSLGSAAVGGYYGGEAAGQVAADVADWATGEVLKMYEGIQ